MKGASPDGAEGEGVSAAGEKTGVINLSSSTSSSIGNSRCTKRVNDVVSMYYSTLGPVQYNTLPQFDMSISDWNKAVADERIGDVKQIVELKNGKS